MMNNNHSIKNMSKGAGIFFVGITTSKILAYLYILIVARLGAEVYGTISLAMIIASIAITLSMIGLNSGVLRYIPYYQAKDDEKRVKGVITSSLKITIPLSIVYSAMIFYGADYVSIKIFHNCELEWILKTFAFFIPFYTVGLLILYMCRAFEKVKYETYTRDIIEGIVRIGMTALLIYMGYGLLGAVVAHVISLIGTFVLAIYFMQKKVYDIFNRNVKSIEIKKELLSYSWPLMISSMFGLMIVWVDALMIGYFMDAYNVGIYRVAFSVATLITIVPTAILVLFVPVVTKAYAEGDLEEVRHTYKTITKWIFIINLPIFLLVTTLSKQILGVMFGAEYAAGSMALVLFGVGYFGHSILSVSGSMLEVFRKPKTVLFCSGFASVLNIGLNYYMISEYGIIGGAVASGISLIINGLLMTVFVLLTLKK